MSGEPAWERAEGRRQAWVLLDQVSARTLAEATVDVCGHFCRGLHGAWGAGPWSPRAHPPSRPVPACGTPGAGARFSRSIVTTGGFWSGHSAFTTSHDVCRLQPTFPWSGRPGRLGSPTRPGLLSEPGRPPPPEPSAVPGWASTCPSRCPDPLPGQRRAWDLSRLRRAHGLLFHGPRRAQHSPPTAEG